MGARMAIRRASKAPPSLLVPLVLAGLTGCATDVQEGRWDNPRDPEGTAYHPPVVGLRDTVIRDPEPGFVLARASSPVRRVASVEWTLDGVLQESRDTALSTAGWWPGSHRVTARATDELGIAGTTVQAEVWIGNLPPRLEPVGTLRQDLYTAADLTLRASDPDGPTPEVSWDTVPDRYSIRSERVRLDPVSGGGRRDVHWRAIDSDGAESRSSFQVRHLPMPTISVQPDMRHPDVLSASGIGGTWTVSLRSGAMVPLVVSAVVPGFPDEPVSVSTEGIACTAAEGALIDNTGFYFQTTHRCAPGRYSSGGYEVTGVDVLGRSAMGSVYISVW